MPGFVFRLIPPPPAFPFDMSVDGPAVMTEQFGHERPAAISLHVTSRGEEAG